MRIMPSLKFRVGMVLPLLAVSMVALLSFVALAVDVGMLAVARTQCQNAADAAAMAGAAPSMARPIAATTSPTSSPMLCPPPRRTASSPGR